MARFINETEAHDLHFELGHLPGIEEFTLRAGLRAWALKRHTAKTLAAHVKKNRALTLIPAEQRRRITHYAEGVELPADRALMLRVTYPRAGTTLAGLALLSLHTPRTHRRAHRQGKSQLHIPNLSRYGVTCPPGDAVDVSLDANGILSSMSTATALVFQQPQLATVNAATATIVVDDHIEAPANQLALARLQGTIEQQGPHWISDVGSTDYQGNQLTWGPAFRANAGQPVTMHSLSSQTTAAVATPMALPLTTSLDDPRLKNSSWSILQGIGSVAHDPSAGPEARARIRRPRAAALGASDPSSDFTLDNLTPGHGLDIDDSSLVFTPGDTPGTGTFSINVMNNYLRSLWAWVQFYGPDNQPLGDFQSIDLVSPVNVILGIPAPTDPTSLAFDWPAAASSAILAHGGLGTSNWQNRIVWPGIILTAVFNYAIPMLFLYAGADEDNNAMLNEIEEEPTIQETLEEVAMAILGPLTANSIGFPNVKTILSAFADGIAGLLVHAGLEELQGYLIEQITEAGIEDAIPYVDLFFEIFNRAVDLAEIAETTIEVLTSPAVYEVRILRSMPLGATVSPDPTHGSPSNPAIWPLDSDHYQCIVQYRGGTSYTTTGPMFGANSSQPVAVTFTGIPEGGTLQVQFGVYAADDTLLGHWTSAWVPAVRPGVGETLTLTGAIQEVLVPLTPNTLYSYKEKLVYNTTASAHVWQSNQFSLPTSVIPDLDAARIDPTITSTFQQNGVTLCSPSVQVIDPGQQWNIVDGTSTYALQFSGETVPEVIANTANAPLAVLPLDDDDTGHNLGNTVGITMSNKAYMLGYCWMASGQNVPPARTGGAPITSQINTFQNINALANPDAALKFSGVGYANQPFIVYDQFGPVPLFSVSSSFVSELNGGSVGAALATLFQQFGYTLPASGVTVTLVTTGVAWTINVNGVATYALQAAAGQVNVYSYPAVTISQNNFYLEPTSTDPDNYQYQVRHIVLDDSTPFNVADDVSWGLFQLPHLSDAVVHPQGYIIGAHAALNTLEILPIPKEPAPDGSAQPSTVVGGLGTRLGLYGGPTALSVTADGRILVLEQGNARIQAIDVNANPVPCFNAAALGSVPPSFATDLDKGLVSTGLRSAFAAAGVRLSSVWRIQDPTTIYQLAAGASAVAVTIGGASPSTLWTLTDGSAVPQVFNLTLSGASINVARRGTPLFSSSPEAAPKLNAGILSRGLAAAFAANGITLMAPLQIVGNGLTLDLSVIGELSTGKVPGSLAPALAAAGITLGSPASVTASVAVRVIQSSARWQLVDRPNNTTYALDLDSTRGIIDLVALSAVAALVPPPEEQTLTYLSMATEAKGYIYVLSYTGTGNDIENFLLDIYSPDGSPLARTTGVNAGDIVVDMWRNLYTLSFESLLGPGGRTEPSISIWTPSVS